MHLEFHDEIDEIIEHGLLLPGWQDSVRLTTEDRAMLRPICEEALDLNKSKNLTHDAIDELSLKVYDIIAFQITSVQERADYISLVYYNSKYFNKLLNLIDEATLCFCRGYFTAALSLLFIILERYLRSVYGWQPRDKDPTFYNLTNSIMSLPDEESASKANKIIKVIYSRYDASSPSLFEFNRHGLLHGVRGPTAFDEMNCARIFQLFNLLCSAEDVDRTGFGLPLKIMGHRYTVFENCRLNRFEIMLTSVDWQPPEP